MRSFNVKRKLLALSMGVAMAVTALATGAFADDPIKVMFWHHRGSGKQYECLKHSVDTFNATVGAEKGIVVEESYISSRYPDLCAQIQLSAQSRNTPNIISVGNTFVAYLLEDDLLVDMNKLAKDEGYDLAGNMMNWVLTIGGNTDGQIHSLPYCRSTPVFYYNKAVAAEIGIEVGESITIEQLKAFGKAATKKNESGTTVRYGHEMLNDPGYLTAASIYELGGQYMAAEGGSPSLDDGTMLKVLGDWREWVDEGWCRPFDASKASDNCISMMLSGELASYSASCSAMGNLMLGASEMGVDIGVAMYPTYTPEKSIVEIGGAQVAIMGCENSEAEIKASWEFVKFLMNDEEQFFNSSVSGYLPCTKSVATYPDMIAFWEKNPGYKVAYTQALNSGRAQELPYLPVGEDFTQIVTDNVSLLIAEQSISAKEAVDKIKAESEDIW